MCACTPKPSWDTLFDFAIAQEGYFSTGQAAEAGYSPQHLYKHIRAGRLKRTRRGIYRFVHFPAGEHEELVVAWLWSEKAGVISHGTALWLHGLSDALLANIHLTLPRSWRARRLRIPEGVVLHHSDVPSNERTWIGGGAGHHPSPHAERLRPRASPSRSASPGGTTGRSPRTRQSIRAR